jgi:hypothetical protein
MLRISTPRPRRRAFADFVNTTPEMSRTLAEEKNKDIASMDKLLRVVSASGKTFLPRSPRLVMISL